MWNFPTEVNDQDLFDGKQIAWHIPSGNKRLEGCWKDGYWHGKWKFWDQEATLSDIAEFEMGKPIRCKRLIDGVMKDVAPEEWARLRKVVKQRSPEGIKRVSGNEAEQAD